MSPFRPINTLANQPGQSVNQLALQQRNRPTGHPPPTREPLSVVEPRPKRRKTSHVPTAPPDSADDEDELSLVPEGQQQHVTRFSRNSRYASPSDISCKKVCKSSSNPFAAIEKMMNSASYVQWKREERLMQQSHEAAETVELERQGLVQTRSLNLETSSVRTKPKATNQTSRKKHIQDQSSSPDVIGSFNTMDVKAAMADGPHRQPHHRGSAIEGPGLDGDDEVVRVFSAKRPVRRSPPLEIQQQRPVRLGRPRKGSQARRKPLRDVTGATKTQSIPLDYIAIHEHIKKDPDMVLVLTDNKGTLHLEIANQVVQDTVVQFDRIFRIMFAAHDSKAFMRLESPKAVVSSGIEANKIDMILTRNKDMEMIHGFIGDSTPPDFVEKPVEWMQKIFERREDSQNQHQARRQIKHELPEDIILAEADQKRRRNSVLLMKSDRSMKRPQRKGLVSQLQPDNTQQARGVLKDIQTRPELNMPDYIDEEETNDRTTRTDEADGQERPIARPKDLNTLANSRTTRRSRRSAEVAPLDEPQVAKHSVIYGLGPRWRRPLVYPEIGKKRVTVEFDDLLRLDEGECLNDNLVEFYLRKLAIQLETSSPEAAKRVYWFNTYFYDNLTKNAKGRNSVNFDSVKRWTRSIDLFSYDYIIVPINESFHWYVAIICNLPTLIGDKQDPQEELPCQVTSLESMDDTELNLQPLSTSSQTLQGPTDESGATKSFQELQLEDRGQEEVAPKANTGSKPIDNEEIEDLSPSGNISREPISVVLESNETLERETEPFTVGASPEQMSSLSVDANYPPKSEDSPINVKLQASQRKKKGPPVRTYNPSEPAIVTLDSLDAPHGATVRALKTYLRLEAEDKRGNANLDDSQLKGMTAKGIPHQQNFTDCGLYLLGYMEKFVSGPRALVTSLLQKKLDAQNDWPSLNPSKMRTALRIEIFKLHREQELERMKARNGVKTDDDENAAKPQIPIEAAESESTIPQPNIEDELQTKALESSNIKLEAKIPAADTVSTLETSAIKSTPAKTEKTQQETLLLDESDQDLIEEAKATRDDDEAKIRAEISEGADIVVPDSQDEAIDTIQTSVPSADSGEAEGAPSNQASTGVGESQADLSLVKEQLENYIAQRNSLVEDTQQPEGLQNLMHSEEHHRNNDNGSQRHEPLKQTEVIAIDDN